MGCKNIKGIVYTSDNDKDHVNDFSRIRCKQWTCGYCALKNRQQWRAVIFKFIDNNPDLSWSFWTITLPSYVTSEGSYQFVREEWDKLIKALRVQYGNFSYVRVLENHKSGKLHVHMLASIRIADARKVTRKDGSYYWTSDIAKSIVAVDNKKRKKDGLRKVSRRSWGYIFSVENLDTLGKSVRYVTKYMTKRDADFEAKSKSGKVRIVQTSRDIKFKQEKATGASWRVKSAIFPDDMRLVGWFDLNKSKMVEMADLTPFYPSPSEFDDDQS